MRLPPRRFSGVQGAKPPRRERKEVRPTARLVPFPRESGLPSPYIVGVGLAPTLGWCRACCGGTRACPTLGWCGATYVRTYGACPHLGWGRATYVRTYGACPHPGLGRGNLRSPLWGLPTPWGADSKGLVSLWNPHPKKMSGRNKAKKITAQNERYLHHIWQNGKE